MVLNKYLSLATLLLFSINISFATRTPATDWIVAFRDVHEVYKAAIEAIRLTEVITILV